MFIADHAYLDQHRDGSFIVCDNSHRGSPPYDRLIGRALDTYVVPLAVGDLCARIVAEALAQYMDDRANRLERYFPLLAAKARRVVDDLEDFAVGEDEVTRSYVRDCWDAYEAAF